MITLAAIQVNKNNRKKYSFSKDIKRNYELYLLTIPTFIYFMVFHYGPMYGLQIAFKNFIPKKGFIGSPWVGLEHFTRFISSYNFSELVLNTLGISIYQLVLGFPIPIILALMLNEVRHDHYRKVVQMITYAPHFISIVVMVGMITIFLTPDTGIINQLLKATGHNSVSFMSIPKYFKSIYVFSGIWQGVGWGSIIYISVLAGVDPQLHEAAVVDGASKLRRMWTINVPAIIPTAIILLILSTGRIMSVGFEKVFLMQNPLNLSSSQIISTYVYKIGLLGGDYSFSTAVGLFNSVINFIILISVNQISSKLGETSLW